jgi:sugar transferase EpsL
MNMVLAGSSTGYRVAKRVMDVAGALVCALLAAPLMAVAAWAIRWRMGRPVLFRHCRPGLGERPFMCLKFRTMREDRDSRGVLLADAERLTPLGDFLRRTSLDELPQLWNVLKGEMSLVGPRPLEFRYLPRYTATQRRRHEVLPGITGWAQVHGRNAIDWDRKFALDLWYVNHRSLWVDLKILLMTFWKVLSAHGVTEPGQATASEFWGIAGAPHGLDPGAAAGEACLVMSDGASHV